MNAKEAQRLIDAAVPAGPGTWADFGAGDGTFTRSLAARLGSGARIYAVDRDARALRTLERAVGGYGAEVTIVHADLGQAFELPDAGLGTLDGFLLANTLHFMRDAAAALARLVMWVRPSGIAVLIEYDRRSPSRWVPHPIDSVALPALFAAAGLTRSEIVARADSAFGGEIYVAVGRRR